MKDVLNFLTIIFIIILILLGLNKILGASYRKSHKKEYKDSYKEHYQQGQLLVCAPLL